MANLKKQLKISQPTSPKQPRNGVATYHRVSSDKQAKEDTIQRQISITRGVFNRLSAADPSLQLIGDFNDEGYNLEARDDSREFWKLLKLILEGLVHVIVIASEDRIFRGESAALRGLITDTLRHNNIRLITPNSDTLYARSQTTARLVTSITQELGAINKLETVKMLQSGRRRKLAEEDKWFLSVTPYGLRCRRIMEGHTKRYVYELVEEEARIVKDIFSLYVGDKPECLKVPRLPRRVGATKIAEILNDNGASRDAWIASLPQGMATAGWDKQKVLRILKNSTYAGELVVTFSATNKVSGYEDITTSKTIDVPAVVSRGLFDRTQDQLRQVRSKLLDTAEPRIERNFLHGLVECPTCKAKLTGRLAAKGLRYYGCPNHHGLFRAEVLEEQVQTELRRVFLDRLELDRLLDRLQTSRAPSEMATLKTRIAAKEAEVAELKLRQAKLASGWASGILDDYGYRAAAEETTAVLALKEAEAASDRRELDGLSLASQRPQALQGLAKALETAWNHADLRYRLLRAIAHEVLLKITINHLEIPAISEMSLDQLKAAYIAGRVMPKDLRDNGWGNRRIFSELGKTSRKTRLDYEANLIWLGSTATNNLNLMP